MAVTEAGAVSAPTVADLLAEIQAATQRMSRTNPHRRLLVTCGVAVQGLAERIVELEARVQSLEAL